MDRRQTEERSPIVVAGGIFLVIITVIIVLGLVGRSQMPVDVTQLDGADNQDTVEAVATEAGDASTAENESVGDSESASESVAENESTDEDTGGTETSTTETSSEESATAATEVDNVSSAVQEISLTDDELGAAFAAGGCSACHVIPNVMGAVGQLGPDLSTIGTVAATRVDGQSAEEYIRQSLLDPQAYIVADCPTGACPADLMLASYVDVLKPEEVDGIVNYLLTLTGDVAEATADDTTADDTASEEVATEGEQSVDLAAVSAIVAKGTCAACHVIPGIEGAVGAVGPDLSDIGATAGTRIDGYTAEEYLRESITNPNAFIAPECPAGDCFPGVMLPNLADILTEEEIDMLIDYLLTLDGQRT